MKNFVVTLDRTIRICVEVDAPDLKTAEPMLKAIIEAEIAKGIDTTKPGWFEELVSVGEIQERPTFEQELDAL